MSDTEEEVIWRNGHGFRNRPELAMHSPGKPSRPYIDCKKCGTRADAADAARPCIGYPVHIPPSGHGLNIEVEFTPKGRKPITERIWFDIDALGALLDLARQFPRENRGHAYWHWRNPDREYPCETCPGPGGEAARRLAAGKATAIDAAFREEPKALPGATCSSGFPTGEPGTGPSH